jgi:hypothetical protein
MNESESLIIKSERGTYSECEPADEIKEIRPEYFQNLAVGSIMVNCGR